MEREKISMKVSILALMLALTVILSGCSAAQGISYDGAYMDAVSYTHLDVYKRQV